MSTRRLASITNIPPIIGSIFNRTSEPCSSEEKLWRERAARMILDALGHTNLTMKPRYHNEVVRYSRRWFRGLYESLEDIDQTDSAIATFDSAGIDSFSYIRDAVLSTEPRLYHSLDDEESNK